MQDAKRDEKDGLQKIDDNRRRPGSTCVWCVCVCVCAHFAAGGQCMPDSHCPTKTLSVCGDIWPDQPDVPAFGLASGPPVALE